jgi:hypothetical protein
MAKQKKTIRFWGGEHRPQRLASGLVGFKSPLEIVVPPRQAITVDLKMTSDAALLFLGEPLRLVQPGENITVIVKNIGEQELRFEAGEVVARAVPLWLGDYEIA